MDQDYAGVLAALCVWREARGECPGAKRAVAHVIRNRAAQKFRGTNPIEVILWPKQFSCFNAGDPNATLFPTANDAAFRECREAVANPGDDPTGGALYYHSCAKPPRWAEKLQLTARIGAFRFYR
jgi:spore germination cell wall hydrolase CwlJ-like protein